MNSKRPSTRARRRAAWRSVRIAGHLLLGAVVTVTLALRRQLGKPTRSTPAIVRWWYRHLLPMLGLEISAAQGSPLERALLVANHISWLDVPVLGSLVDINFLSKDEVRHWPLIGWMSAQLGTLFIKRGGSQTQVLSQRIESEIRAGRPVVLFPEGTTSDGRQLRHFHPRLLGAAQQPDLAVQPVAIRYGTNAEPDPYAPFIDDDTLLAHLWRLLQQPSLRVEVQFLEPIPSAGLDRRALAQRCRNAIASALQIELNSESSDRTAPKVTG